MPTDPNRAKEVLVAAIQIKDPAERAAYLDRECDPELRRWVDALLWAYDRPGSAPPDLTGEFTPTADESGPSPRRPDPTSDEPRTSVHEPDDRTGAFHPSSAPDETTGIGNASAGPTATYNPDPSATVREADLPSLIGGRYRIVSVIGEGGMGSVYLARQDEPVKREVALKLIKHGADSRTVVARFEAERQALALMDHPNIARVYDGGTTENGQPFFVMELVRGIPITKFCDENKLSPKDRLELFVQVCRAVQHAHQKGIIHRDLKPGNILVTVVDGRPTPKVIDFGVAKAIEQRLTDSSFADAEAIVGTPAYMSPEQTDPSIADIDTRTDVYALGVVLYELLAGLPPISPKEFRKGAILEMLRMVREVEPDHLSTKASSADALPNIAASRGLEPAQLLSFLRGDVDWIVLKSLEKDRERRYDSANGMAADIMRYLANEPVLARPPSRAYRLKKFVRRNRGPVLAAALVGFALAIGVIGVVLQWREAVYQRNQADLARQDAENNARVAQEQRKVALDTIGGMVVTIRAELTGRADLQDAVTKLLRIAQESLNSIIQNPAVTISLNDTTRAVIHDFNARTQREVGNTSAALAEFNNAAEIFQTILDQSPEGPDKEVIKKDLMIVLISAGQTSLKVGGAADARRYYDRAAQLIGQIDNKAAVDYRKILISLYSSLGATSTKPRESRGNFLEALRLAEELAKQETAAKGKPTDEARLTLLRMYILVGGVEGRLRDARSREQYYGKALAIAQDMLKTQPEDKGRKWLVATAHERIGDSLLRSNNPAAAAKEFASAAELFRVIAEKDSKNVSDQENLARIRYSQGLAALRDGDKDGAAKYFQASLDIRKNWADLKTELDAQRNLMMSLAQIGRHQEAVDVAENTVRVKLSKDPAALVDIANCYAVCSVVVPAAKDRETHDRYVARALETLKQAIDAGYGDKVNLETEPDLDGIRDQAEFKALLNRLPEP